MSNIAAIRKQLFGTPVRAARAAQPHDHLSKAQMWTRIQALEAQLAAANRKATVARNAIQTLGTEGTPAYQALTSARADLRELCAMTSEVR